MKCWIWINRYTYRAYPGYKDKVFHRRKRIASNIPKWLRIILTKNRKMLKS